MKKNKTKIHRNWQHRGYTRWRKTKRQSRETGNVGGTHDEEKQIDTITRFVTRLTRRAPLMEQELFTFPEHLSSPPVFSGVRVTRSLVLCVMFCRSLFVFFSFFFLPLCCLSFFDLRNLITPLVSSISASPFSVAGFVVGSPTPKPFSCYACVDLPSGETCNTTTVCPAGHVRIISIWLLIWFTILQSSLCRSYAFCFV